MASSDNMSVADLVERVLKTIKAAELTGQEMVTFDFTGSPRYIVSSAIMSAVTGLGYVAFIMMSGGAEERDYEKMYIDLTRRRDKR